MNTTTAPQGITLAHGLTRLHVFAQRFQGWCSDYLGDSDVGEEDYFDATLSQVWGQLLDSVMRRQPIPADEMLLCFVQAIAQSELGHWSAFDPDSKKHWDALHQSYRDFVLEHPGATPYVRPTVAPGDSVFTARLSQFLQDA